MTALVSIRKVTKVYELGRQRVEVLHGIDLEIPAQDFVAPRARRQGQL